MIELIGGEPPMQLRVTGAVTQPQTHVLTGKQVLPNGEKLDKTRFQQLRPVNMIDDSTGEYTGGPYDVRGHAIYLWWEALLPQQPKTGMLTDRRPSPDYFRHLYLVTRDAKLFPCRSLLSLYPACGFLTVAAVAAYFDPRLTNAAVMGVAMSEMTGITTPTGEPVEFLLPAELPQMVASLNQGQRRRLSELRVSIRQELMSRKACCIRAVQNHAHLWEQVARVPQLML